MKKAVLVLSLLAAGAASAEVYQWTDKEGVVHFTEDPEEIPKKYRKQMKGVGVDVKATDESRKHDAETTRRLQAEKDQRERARRVAEFLDALQNAKEE